MVKISVFKKRLSADNLPPKGSSFVFFLYLTLYRAIRRPREPNLLALIQQALINVFLQSQRSSQSSRLYINFIKQRLFLKLL